MSEGKVRTAAKISAEEAKTLDHSRMGVAVTDAAKASEVEGQAIYEIYGGATCPWCGAAVRVILDTDVYRWYKCGACGQAFRM
jgi:hypothetical protein